MPEGSSPTRFIGLDIHKDYFVAAGVDAGQATVLNPQRVENARLESWIRKRGSRKALASGPGATARRPRPTGRGSPPNSTMRSAPTMKLMVKSLRGLPPRAQSDISCR